MSASINSDNNISLDPERFIIVPSLGGAEWIRMVDGTFLVSEDYWRSSVSNIVSE